MAPKDACNLCLQQFESKQDMETHISKHHKLSEFQYTLRCVICDISYTRKDQLRKHMKSKHNLGYECSICKKKLPSKLTLKQHKTNEHKTVHGKSDLCPLCGKAFKDPNYLQQHISEVCNNQWKGNKCLMCNETFESRLFTIEHIAAKHQDVKLYDCSDCSSRFLSEKLLKLHTSNMHGNKARSICPICGKSKTDLPNHILYVHEGKERPKLQCKLCENSYTNRESLKKHIRSVHEGKTFKCSDCTEDFKSR